MNEPTPISQGTPTEPSSDSKNSIKEEAKSVSSPATLANQVFATHDSKGSDHLPTRRKSLSAQNIPNSTTPSAANTTLSGIRLPTLSTHNGIPNRFVPPNAPVQPPSQKWMVGLISALCLMAFVAGILSARMFFQPTGLESPTELEEPKLSVSIVEELHELDERKFLELVDEKIEMDRWEEARTYLVFWKKEHKDKVPPEVIYRYALCLESQQKYEQAAQQYGEIRENAQLTPLTVAVRLGQIRCWNHMKRTEEARHQLAKLILMSGHPVIHPSPMFEELWVQQVRLNLEGLPNRPAPDPLNAKALATANLKPHLDETLHWLHAHGPADSQHVSKENPEHPPEKQENQTMGIHIEPNPKNVEQNRLRGQLPPTPIRTIVEQIASQSNLKLQFSGNAEDLLAGRTMQVYLAQMPLMDCLNALLNPCQVRWKIEDQILSLDGKSSGEEEPAQDRQQQTTYSLRRTLALAPKHPAAAGVVLELGNISFVNKDWKEALDWYQRVRSDYPFDPEALHATYNLGLTRFQQKEYAKARQFFLEVVDRGQEEHWFAMGWLWLGRTLLEEGDPERAIKPLQKAKDLGDGSEVTIVAALYQAVAHLMLQQPSKAHTHLARYSKEFRQSKYKSFMTVLDCLIRHQDIVQKKKDSRVQAEELLEALIQNHNQSPIGTTGLLILGQAYRELGLGKKMIDLYEVVIPELQGALAIRMTWEVAEEFFVQGDWEQAKQNYLAIVTVAERDKRAESLPRLAEIALQQNQPDQAIQYAKQYRLERPDQHEIALKWLGRAYMLKKDFAKANLCFEGQWPKEPLSK